VGGFTPLITSWLVVTSGNKAAPGIYLSILAALGFVSALLLKRLRPSDQLDR
jgi:MHS family citrate/tricarballylate:H+ symporter-like MFS transporter